MKSLRAFVLEHPTVASVVVMTLAIALTEVKVPFSASQDAGYVAGFVEQALVGVLLLLLAREVGILPTAGLNRPHAWKRVWVAWPLLVLVLLNSADLFAGNISIDTGRPVHILLFILVYISTGFFEEILCRGFVLNLLLRKWGATRHGTYGAALVSSALFGAYHLIHFFNGTMTFAASITQVTYAFFFGVFFAACFIRNESLWPVIIGHALVDIAGSLGEISVGWKIPDAQSVSLADALVSIAIFALFLIYGLWLLRKTGRAPILAAPSSVPQPDASSPLNPRSRR